MTVRSLLSQPVTVTSSVRVLDAVVGDCSAAIHVCLRRLSPRGSTWRSAANFLRSKRPSAVSAASESAGVCSSGKVIARCRTLLRVLPTRISLADLCELQTRHIQNAMKKLEFLLRNHVMHCNHCRQVSRRCRCGTYCVKLQLAALRTPLAVRRGVAPDVTELDPINESGLQALPRGSPTESPQTSFVPIRVESFLEKGHSPGAAQPPLLLDDDALVLCRTCDKYCHAECFLSAEVQCRSCTQLHPDVLPPERSFAPDARGQYLSTRPSSTYYL